MGCSNPQCICTCVSEDKTCARCKQRHCPTDNSAAVIFTFMGNGTCPICSWTMTTRRNGEIYCPRCA